MDGWTTASKMAVEVGWGRQSYKLPGPYCSCDSCEFFFGRYYEATYAEDENIL